MKITVLMRLATTAFFLSSSASYAEKSQNFRLE